MARAPRDPRRLGPIATVAGWLRIWTPPRDAVLAPVPWRALAIGLLALAAIAGATVALVAPRIERAKRTVAERELREDTAAAAAARRRLAADQRPRGGRLRESARPAQEPGGRGSGSEPSVARRAVVGALEAAITADARERVRRGAAAGQPPSRTDCRPRRGTIRGHPRRVAYDCFAAQRPLPGGGMLGLPFSAVVDFGDSAYVWCKTNPPAGERGVPRPSSTVALSEACTG